MSNQHRKFSFEYRLPSASAHEAAIALGQRAQRIHQDEEPPDEFPEELRSALDNWIFEVESADLQRCAIRVHSERGGMDSAAAFVQHLIRLHNPTSRFGFQWCQWPEDPTDSGPVGGAIIVSADSVEEMLTGSWLHRQLRQVLIVHRLELKLEIDRGLNPDKEVQRLIENINEFLGRELPEHDAALICHRDEIEIEEHQ